jgi:hypothetical protein
MVRGKVGAARVGVVRGGTACRFLLCSVLAGRRKGIRLGSICGLWRERVCVKRENMDLDLKKETTHNLDLHLRI